MKRKSIIPIRMIFFFLTVLLLVSLFFMLWFYVPATNARRFLVGICIGLMLLSIFWIWDQRRRTNVFADDLCQTFDALISGHKLENKKPYDESPEARVHGRLMRYYEILKEESLKSKKDKKELQELISDISHQVKNPIASIQMYASILQKHKLTNEKQEEFLHIMTEQIQKLSFLMDSLIKISRLEAGTFELHKGDCCLNDTIVQAINSVWAKAESKNIQLSAQCDSTIMVLHDPKWTAEALGNILDNGIKYTPSGGNVMICVKPWQLYIRIDIMDTGIGIAKEHYHDIFQRFYRTKEAAAKEGVGLGLYLANNIINRQKGYISVHSKIGEGTVFSIYLPK